MDYHIDASGKPLGRIASEIAGILQGKKRASYNPRTIGNDRVIVKNIRGVVVTGKKMEQKVYHRHTGYMGHLRTARFADELAKHPERVLREAVRHMLPKNFLNQRRLKNLLFTGERT